jgi:hypothetical protein
VQGDDGDQQRRERADLPHSSHEDRALRGPTTTVAIDEYRAHLSPRLRGVVTCRFTPS